MADPKNTNQKSELEEGYDFGEIQKVDLDVFVYGMEYVEEYDLRSYAIT